MGLSNTELYILELLSFSNVGLTTYKVLESIIEVERIDVFKEDLTFLLSETEISLEKLNDSKLILTQEKKGRNIYSLTEKGQSVVKSNKQKGIKSKESCDHNSDFTEIELLLSQAIDGDLVGHQKDIIVLLNNYLNKVKQLQLDRDELFVMELDEVMYYIYLNKLVNNVLLKGDEVKMLKKEGTNIRLINFIEDFIGTSKDFIDDFRVIEQEVNRIKYSPDQDLTDSEKLWFMNVERYVGILEMEIRDIQEEYLDKDTKEDEHNE